MVIVIGSFIGNSINYFIFLKNLIENFKINFFFGNLILSFLDNKITNFILSSKNFKLIHFLKDYKKISCKLNIYFEIINLKKKSSEFKKNRYFSNYDNKFFQFFLIKKKNFKSIKNLKLIEKFNIFSIYSFRRNFKANLFVKFFNSKQIKYFCQSICDEILLSGKFKFILKKRKISISTNTDNFQNKPTVSEVLISCYEKKKNSHYNLFFLILSKKIPFLNLKSSLEIYSTFSFMKKKKLILKNKKFYIYLSRIN